MKTRFASVFCCPAATRAVLFGITLLVAASACAQNFVKNPDFEQPLGPDNWTVVYLNSGPFDFLVAGRTTMAHKDMVPGAWDGNPYYWSKLGGHFAPNYCNGLPEAYFKQVVTGLTPGASYACSVWMVQNTRNDNYLARSQVWMEAWGGPNLATLQRTAYATDNANNNPGGWRMYAVTNTASQNGEIEIRLRYKFIQTIAQTWEYRNINAHYDHVAVVPAGQSGYAPPFSILSFDRSHQDIRLKWETVMNNKYRLQVSSDLSNPASWSFVQWNPKVDTNIHATGTSHTFQTNLLSLFSYDPSFDPDAPLFFRIYSEPYVP